MCWKYTWNQEMRFNCYLIVYFLKFSCIDKYQWKFDKWAARDEVNISTIQWGQCSRAGPGTPRLATYPGDGKLISELTLLVLWKKYSRILTKTSKNWKAHANSAGWLRIALVETPILKDLSSLDSLRFLSFFLYSPAGRICMLPHSSNLSQSYSLIFWKHFIFLWKILETWAVSSNTLSSPPASSRVLSIGTCVRNIYKNYIRDNFDTDLSTARKTTDDTSHASPIQIQNSPSSWSVLTV